MSNEMGPDCIRCGLCCIAGPCGLAPLNAYAGDTCSNLHVNEDLTTTCLNKEAVEFYADGSGCFIRGLDVRHEGIHIYKLHCGQFNIDTVKEVLLAQQKEEGETNGRKESRVNGKSLGS